MTAGIQTQVFWFLICYFIHFITLGIHSKFLSRAWNAVIHVASVAIVLQEMSRLNLVNSMHHTPTGLLVQSLSTSLFISVSLFLLPFCVSSLPKCIGFPAPTERVNCRSDHENPNVRKQASENVFIISNIFKLNQMFLHLNDKLSLLSEVVINAVKTCKQHRELIAIVLSSNQQKTSFYV